MDQYMIIYDDKWLHECLCSTLEELREDFVEKVTKYPQDSIEVRKMNLTDGTCRDVTGDMVDLTFPDWDKDAKPDEQMPYVYAKFNCERAPTYDNSEHRTHTTAGGHYAA